MSPRAGSRVTPCTASDARARSRKAESFITGAELVLEMGDDADLDLPAVAAALAVLAGIAAADAACCSALGEHARGQDHQQAVRLLGTVAPNGTQMAKDLKRLLDRKDNAHYGVITTTENEARDMLTWAQRLVTGARAVVRR
jgi:hypothetical protein